MALPDQSQQQIWCSHCQAFVFPESRGDDHYCRLCGNCCSRRFVLIDTDTETDQGRIDDILGLESYDEPNVERRGRKPGQQKPKVGWEQYALF